MAQFGSDKRERYLELLREGARRMTAAEAVVVSYSTVWRAMQSDTEFQTAVNQAEMRANELVEDALFHSATNGNVTAMQVWLYNRNPEDWRDMRGSRTERHDQNGTAGLQSGTEQDDSEELSKPADPDRVIQLSKSLRETG